MGKIIFWGGQPSPYRGMRDFARRLWQDESGGPLALLAPLGMAGLSAAFPATMAGILGTAAAPAVAGGAGLIPAGSSLLAPGAVAPLGAGFTATGPITGGATLGSAVTPAVTPAATGMSTMEMVKAGSGLLSNVMGMFGPEAPTAPDPSVMPDPDDEAIKLRKQKEFARKRQSSGRLSTINTDEPLG